MDDPRAPSPPWSEAYPPYRNPFDPPLDVVEMQRFTSPHRDLSEQHGSPEISPGLHFPQAQSPPTGQAYGLGHLNASGYFPLPVAPPVDNVPYCKSSGTASVNTLERSRAQYKSDPDTQALVNRRAGELARWRIHWQIPAMMVALFLSGVLGAVSHHIFYAHLDGKPAVNQLKLIRYGTALAFFTKATLVGSVVLSFRQRIWHTFREKAMTISAIDGLFAVCEDLSQFSKLEMLRNAKLASLMALATWLIPIAAVLSPASLTSEVRLSTEPGICPTVPTLNFTNEAFFNFRDTKDFPGFTLSFYNTTDAKAEKSGWFDYWDQPSKVAKRLTTTSMYLKKPVNNDNATVASCGMGWNCTYELSFTGPGYNCEEVANDTQPNTQLLQATSAPFDLTALAPQGENIYLSNVDIGDYADPQTPTDEQGQPIGAIPSDLGVFKSEPVIWIGYVINTSSTYPSTSQYASNWTTVQSPKIFRCVHHETQYTVRLNMTDGIQYSEVTERKFLAPVVDTTVVSSPPNNTISSITPESNFIRPDTDVPLYKRTAAYHALGSLLRNFLQGTITDQGVYVQTKSDISETRLIDQRTSYPVDDLMMQVQSVYEDMILTLLSEPHLVVAQNTSVPCTRSRNVNVFVYHEMGLWVGYAIVVFIALVFIIIGGVSMYNNGVASDTLFSRIMVTTRNPTIDRLSVGACLGSDPFPAELRRTKLRFGVLLEDDEIAEAAGRGDTMYGRIEHCTFGTVGETKDIVKYGTYAGLKKLRDHSAGSECGCNGSQENEKLMTGHDHGKR